VVNDIAGDTTTSYVVRKRSTLTYFPNDFLVGDVLTSIDGMSPDDWLDEVAPLHISALPDDPAQYAATRSILLADLVSNFATTIVVSRCTAGGSCTPRPAIDVASTLAKEFESTGYFLGGPSFSCADRFTPAVASAASTYDDYKNDSVAFSTTGGITSIQFDGFEPPTVAAWESSMTSALAAGGPFLFDARMGHGGRIDLGRWFMGALRDQTDPVANFAMPRGSIDDPDPAWLFDPSWDACYNDATYTFDACDWGSNGSFGSSQATALTMGAKIAWLDTLDVSMNDVVPRMLQGLPTARIFGPFPTSGSFGEISSTPPLMGNWDAGSIQVTDIRVGSTSADARTQPWNSGKGTVPDQVVAQTLSDLLAGQDTIVNAARAWLVMP
jgi:hypothetical protein